jgi:hypothetical protein
VLRDAIVLAMVIVGLASLVTTHLAIAWSLVERERPRWRGLVALVVPPLAPVWAWRAGLRARSGLWLASLVAYAVGRALGRA